MGSVLIQLVPLVIGSIAMPSWALLVLALLSGGRGVVEACAVVAGITAVRLLQGIVFETILGRYKISYHLYSLEMIVSAALIVLGVLLWVMALSQIRKRKSHRTLMSIVGTLTPVRAMGLGVLLVMTSARAWIFTLAALGVIEQAEISFAHSVVAYLLYVLGAESLLIGLILVSARSSARFDAVTKWLEEYNRPILGIVSAAVGSFFLWRGITGLIR